MEKFKCKLPKYIDSIPPCNQNCPTGQNIQKWLAFVENNQIKEAWETMMDDNPMPSVTGRACYHPCEDSCNRGSHDDKINIHAVERYVADTAIEQCWTVACKADTHKKVMIVGAGPAGIAAAYHLRRFGHDVTVFDSQNKPGGMMYSGIPEFRLPYKIIEQETKRIEEMGVKFVLNYSIKDLKEEKAKGEFDAVFIGIGAHLGRVIEIQGEDQFQVIDAGTYLKANLTNSPINLPDSVAIYGGGNTAMDVARTVRRKGVKKVYVIYRKDQEAMPAHVFEQDETLEEGIKFCTLRVIKSLSTSGVHVDVIEKINGQYRPTGEAETIDASCLILALGQLPGSEFLENIYDIIINNDHTIQVNDQMMTGHEGVFAGGDMLPYDRTITTALGHGKKAARYINGYLTGVPYKPRHNKEEVPFSQMHLWVDLKQEMESQSLLSAEVRQTNFKEVVSGLNKEQAVFEATRCLSCGNCFECDGCLAICPEDAVTKLTKRYKFDYDKCSGCGACFEQCPCTAIKMLDKSEVIASN